MRYRKTAATLAVVLLATVGVVTLSGCSSQAGAAEAKVKEYLSALAAGDAAKAHRLNPYSPILTAEGAAASAAAPAHLTAVNVGGFVEAKKDFDSIPTAMPSPTASSSAGRADWSGIDWEDETWTGGKDDSSLKDVRSITQGVVPVTFKVGDSAERTAAIGVAFGRDSTGAEQFAFRSVVLSNDLAATYGAAKAVPALPPASVKLAGGTAGETDNATPWWETVGQKVDDATTMLSREATISGAKVTLTENSLLLLPGVYDIAVGQPSEGALWAASAPAPQTVALAPADEHVVKLGAPTVTEAGKALVQAELQRLAQAKFNAMVDFTPSDREQVCGTLAPSMWGSSRFEDDTFTVRNTNIANGGISIAAVSSNKATGTRAGNGSDSFADGAFCSGQASADATSYTVPVEVETSSLTPGTVATADDGTFTTTTPWSLAMTTKVSTFGNADAAGKSVPFGKPKVKTTYTATVAINWLPSGKLTDDGKVEVSNQ